MEANDPKDYARVRALTEKLHMLGKLSHQVRLADSVPSGVFGILATIDGQRERTGESQIHLGQLCRRLHRSMPSITRSVNTLEADGLVEKTASTEDRRRVYVSLTGKGEAVLAQSRDARYGLMEAILESLGEADTERLIAIIDRLGVIMDDMAKENTQHQGEHP